MDWIPLNSLNQLTEISESTDKKKSVIFKHSTRCSISDTVLNRLERNWNNDWKEKANFYYLDLIEHRDISNQIAQKFVVEHQSPQILIIEQGKTIYSESHMGIQPAIFSKVL